MKILFYILTIVLSTLSPELFACSCNGQSTVKEAFSGSEGVVKGTVISKELVVLVDSASLKMTSNVDGEKKGFPYEMTVAKYQLLIESNYKGRFDSDTIDIYTGIGRGDCGIRFEIGKKYIIYGDKESYFGFVNNNLSYPKGKNILWTNICTRTTALNQEEIIKIEKYIRKN